MLNFISCAEVHSPVNVETDGLVSRHSECLLQVLALYESTFVGLQAMGSHFPKDSAELQAAEEALMAVLSKLVTELKGVYENDMLYQVCRHVGHEVGVALGWCRASGGVSRGGIVHQYRVNGFSQAGQKRRKCKQLQQGLVLMPRCCFYDAKPAFKHMCKM